MREVSSDKDLFGFTISRTYVCTKCGERLVVFEDSKNKVECRKCGG